MTGLDMPVVRIDSFTVPARARAAFLERVGAIHQILRRQPGFVLDRIVERTLDDGAARMITVVEWTGEAAIAGAVRAVREATAGEQVSSADFIAENGITADIGLYRSAR